MTSPIGLGPSLIEAGGGLVADLFGFGSAAQQEQFQEHMADTQYQRGTADMRAAGLNPLLMMGQGSPAPTPQGTMFTPDNPVKGIAQNIAQSQVQSKSMELMDSQSDAAEASANLAGAQLKTQATQQGLNTAAAAREIANARLSQAQVNQAIATTNREYTQSSYNSALAAGATSDNVQKLREAEIFDSGPVGTILKALQIISPIAGRVR